MKFSGVRFTQTGIELTTATSVTDEIKVMVVDPPFPQLTALASELAKRGMLGLYLHSFVSTNSANEKLIVSIPFFGERFAGELRRRVVPANIDPRQIRVPARRYEIIRAMLTRLPSRLRPYSRFLSQKVMWRRNRVLGRFAQRVSFPHTAIIASYGTALESFESSDSRLRVLDYPIAHHTTLRREMAVEASRYPELSRNLGYDKPASIERVLDREIKAADLILVGSKYARDTFTEQGVDPRKILVAPYPLLPVGFSPRKEGPIRDPFRIGFVGQICARKGIGDLLQAYDKVRTPQTELLLVGNFIGPSESFSNYRHLFTHVPHVPHHELPALMRSLSVLVLPSISEGLGLVVLEAMASGVPVIVTPNGPGEVVRDGVDGFVVPIRNPELIAERMTQLIENAALHKEMGKNALNRSTDFDPEVYSARVIDEVARRLHWKKRPHTQSSAKSLPYPCECSENKINESKLER